MHIHHDESRRAFLRRAALLGMAGTAAPFVNTLGAIGEAAAATGSGYKALVCVFLHGGNDYGNTLIPYDQDSYAAYAQTRAALALSRDTLSPLVPDVALAGGRQYAMAPSLAPLADLFAKGVVAPVMNVGTLVQPITKAQYNARSAPVPPKLFSHNDQQSFFQASNPEGATSGWGGRMGDLFQSGNGAATLTCINASGNAVYLTGKSAVQYAIGTGGPTGVYFVVGQSICRLIHKAAAEGRKTGRKHGIRCSAPSTGGSTYNIGQIREVELDFGVAQSDWQFHAYNGSSKYKGKAFKKLRAVFSVHPEPYHIIVGKGSAVGGRLKR